MTKRNWSRGTQFTVGGKKFKVYAILDEPNTGLVQVMQTDHPMHPLFTMPWEFVDALTRGRS